MTTVVNVIELVTLPLMRSNKIDRLYMASFLSLVLYLRARLEPTQEEHLPGEPYPDITSRNIKLRLDNDKRSSLFGHTMTKKKSFITLTSVACTINI